MIAFGIKPYSRVEMDSQVSKVLCDLSGNLTLSSMIKVGVQLVATMKGQKELSVQQKIDQVVKVMVCALDSLKASEVKNVANDPEQIKTVSVRFDMLEKTVKESLPAAIEIAVDAAHGHIDMKQLKPSTFLRGLACCMSFAVAQNVLPPSLEKTLEDIVPVLGNVADAADKGDASALAAVVVEKTLPAVSAAAAVVADAADKVLSAAVVDAVEKALPAAVDAASSAVADAVVAAEVKSDVPAVQVEATVVQ